MGTINRAVAVVKPKEPYRQWALSLPGLPDEISLDDLRAECTCYLLPERKNRDGYLRFIRSVFTDLFEWELEAWCRDETTWPRRRDWKTFSSWFDVEVHSMVFDLGRDMIEEGD